ncbi:MAG: hypothetical protein U0931_32930 [Vulcanimicrobiota bacterium]
MLAFALNPQSDKDLRRNAPQRAKPPVNLTVHERFVLKAEAIFPGAEIVSHQSQET